MFRSTKVIDGFSCCFRQWISAPIHCSKLHGYSIHFKVTFEGALDFRNWVIDFGFMKRSKNKINYKDQEFTPDEWFKFMFDHSVVIAEDDPQLDKFFALHMHEALNLRIVPQVGCEMFAKLVFDTLDEFLLKETDGRVHMHSVECFEHGKNSAIYIKD